MWGSLIKLSLDDFLESSEKEENIVVCERCGTKMPEHVALCWQCGNVLDENLRRLIGEER
jgi:ribosomal protein L40E